ncbi:MAG: hypothetical protein M3522_09335 [Actinomycetota bacterium]|nr:hypothetical protein [Actinomycetota bacterium]
MLVIRDPKTGDVRRVPRRSFNLAYAPAGYVEVTASDPKAAILEAAAAARVHVDPNATKDEIAEQLAPPSDPPRSKRARANQED